MDSRDTLNLGVEGWVPLGRSVTIEEASVSPSRLFKYDNNTAGEDVSNKLFHPKQNPQWKLPFVHLFTKLTSNMKSQSKDGSASLPAILAAFIPSLISATLLLLVFFIIKRPFRRIYSPRTYIDVIPEK